MSLPPRVPLPRSSVLQGDPELWERISAYQFDKPSTASLFSARLAQENGWPFSYAHQVIREYRRFIFLACISQGEAIPSDEVEQVWHLHLIHSREYWGDFCENILKRPLHHLPIEGGDDARERWGDKYWRTLKLYQDTFSEGPPMEIWPPIQIRFDENAKFSRFNRSLFAVNPIKRRAWESVISSFVPVFAVLVVAFLLSNLACGPAASPFVTVSAILGFAMIVSYHLWADWGPAVPVALRRIQRRLSINRHLEVRQPQHGFWVEFAVTYPNAGVAGSASVSHPIVAGDGTGDCSYKERVEQSEGGGGGP